MKIRLAALVVVVLAVLVLQEWVSSPSAPFNGVKSVRLRYGARNDIEVTVRGRQVGDLIGHPKEAVGLGVCRCSKQNEILFENKSGTIHGNICEHGLSVQTEKGPRFFQMSESFLQSYQSGCDSLYTPVEGVTKIGIPSDCEPGLRRVFELLRSKIRSYGAPSRIVSKDCERYVLIFPERHAPGILGDREVSVNVETGKVFLMPRM